MQELKEIKAQQAHEDKIRKKSPTYDRYLSKLENAAQDMRKHSLTPFDIIPMQEGKSGSPTFVSQENSENLDHIKYNSEMIGKIVKINDIKRLYKNYQNDQK
jgi:hypothetical protein